MLEMRPGPSLVLKCIVVRQQRRAGAGVTVQEPSASLLLTFCLQLIFIFNSLLPLQEINFKVVYVTIKADPLNFKGHATFY